MQPKNQKELTKKRRLLIGVCICIVIACVSIILAISGSNKHTVKLITSSSNHKSTINLDPATQTEKEDSDSHKADIVKSENSPPTVSSSLTPVIDFAGYNNPSDPSSQIEVDAHVPGVIEDGGTCTLSASLSGVNFTKTVSAVRNAQYTSCPAFLLNRSDFNSSGDWIIKVSYSSSKYSGFSAPQTLKIQ